MRAKAVKWIRDVLTKQNASTEARYYGKGPKRAIAGQSTDTPVLTVADQTQRILLASIQPHNRTVATRHSQGTMAALLYSKINASAPLIHSRRLKIKSELSVRNASQLGTPTLRLLPATITRRIGPRRMFYKCTSPCARSIKPLSALASTMAFFYPYYVTFVARFG